MVILFLFDAMCHRVCLHNWNAWCFWSTLHLWFLCADVWIGSHETRNSVVEGGDRSAASWPCGGDGRSLDASLCWLCQQGARRANVDNSSSKMICSGWTRNLCRDGVLIFGRKLECNMPLQCGVSCRVMLLQWEDTSLLRTSYVVWWFVNMATLQCTCHKGTPTVEGHFWLVQRGVLTLQIPL